MTTPVVTTASSAVSAALNSSSSSSSVLRPVVRTLYRSLLREATQYGAVAQLNNQTVQHELGRLLPTQQNTGANKRSGGEAVQISAIPIGTSSSPAIAIAISPIPSTVMSSPIVEETSTGFSSSPASSCPTSLPSSLLSPVSSSSSSFSAGDVMTPAIAHTIIRSQFAFHIDEQRPAQITRLLSIAFTALRKLKDRHTTLSSAVLSPSVHTTAPSSSTSTSSSSSSSSPPHSHITPTLSSTPSLTSPPSLSTLTTSTTTHSPYTRIHISTSHFKSFPIPSSPSSPPRPSLHLFTYTISITNLHSSPIQLLSRYWSFTDQRGVRQEVEGEGVVGKQPMIRPGEVFQYSSNVNLNERRGRMEGKFQFRVDSEGGTDEREVEGRKRGGRRAGVLRRKRTGKVEEKGAEEEGSSVVEGEVMAGVGTVELSEVEKEKDKEPELFEAAVGPVLLATNEAHERH